MPKAKTEITLSKATEGFEGLPVKGENYYHNFSAQKGGEAVEGLLFYKPGSKEIKIEGVGPKGSRGQSYYALASKARGKTMSLGFQRDLLRSLGEQFPEAETVGGYRITGAKAGQYQSFRIPRPKGGAMPALKETVASRSLGVSDEQFSELAERYAQRPRRVMQPVSDEEYTRLADKYERRMAAERRVTTGSAPEGMPERRGIDRRQKIAEIKRLKGEIAADAIRAANPEGRDTLVRDIPKIEERIAGARQQLIESAPGPTRWGGIPNQATRNEMRRLAGMPPESSIGVDIPERTPTIGESPHVTAKLSSFTKGRALALGALGLTQGAAMAYEEASQLPPEQRAAAYRSEAKLQTGIGTGLAMASKVAPRALGWVGSRVLPPVAVAAGAYDVYRAGEAGYGAYQTRKEAEAERLGSEAKYGTVEAATRTRKRLTGK